MDSETPLFLGQLDPECSAPLKEILRKLLSLYTTEKSVAQIIDGIPMADNYFGPRATRTFSKPHPDIAKNIRPSEEACSKAKEFCSSVELETIKIDSTVS